MASVEDFIIDFSKEESGGGGGIRVKKGIYRVKIVAAKPTVSAEKGTPGLELTFAFLDGDLRKKKTRLKDTLWNSPKAYSRFRLLLQACGKKLPKKVNAAKIAAAVKGCELYIDVEDEKPREGYSKTRSRVGFEGFINPEDYDPDAAEDEDEEEDEDLDEDEEEEDEDLDDDDEDEDDDLEDEDEEEEEEEPPKRKARRKKAAPAAAKKRSKRKPKKDEDEDEDEDLDDLDLDDL